MRWATDARTVLAALGVVLYAVLRIAYSLFYDSFGLTPDDLGLGYLDLLIQSAVGTVILLIVVFVIAALVAAVFVGLIGRIRTASHDLRRGQQPTGPSESERPPAKQESENGTPPPDGQRGRRLGAVIGSVAVAVAAIVLVAVLVGQQVFSLSVFVIAMVWALLVGIRLIHRGLTGETGGNRARWLWGLAAIALATLGFAILLLLLRAESDAARVQLGHASSFTVLGFRVTTWGAEDATVSWTSNQIAADLRPLAGRCLMYLGQSNGTAFLYLVSTHEVFRVPTAVVVVRTQPAACSRK